MSKVAPRSSSWTPRERRSSPMSKVAPRSSWTPRERRSSPMSRALPARDARAGLLPALAGALLLLVVTGQASASEDYESLVLEKQKGSFPESCPAGFYLSDNNLCEPCKEGVDYTSYPNKLQACLSCRVCAPEEIVKHPCNKTSDTVCLCKPGTFREEGSPEFCQKCRTSCPDGKVVASPCTPWNDLKCMDKQSDRIMLTLVVICILFIAIFLVCLCVCVVRRWRRHPDQRSIFARWPGTRAFVHCLKSGTLASAERPRSPTGCGQDSEHRNGVYRYTSRAPGGSEAEDNDHNEVCSRMTSQSSLETETEQRQVVIDMTPGESDCLLGPAEAEKSRVRRQQLHLARDVDPSTALRRVFNYCTEYVHHKSWDPLMRHLGLTPNEIFLARSNQGDILHEMLLTWLNKTGRSASINTLLDALEKVGQKLAMENIEKKAVESKDFTYQEHEMDFTESRV